MERPVKGAFFSRNFFLSKVKHSKVFFRYLGGLSLLPPIGL
ncbi:hypothetical protein HMPREF1863_00433 [Aedoeadaptatus coxii]|uniref:Uncharacterized protein n=1 Tax=Aedoeadaptatus coxii TaxID=755172 RepID=A0A134AJ60_9FIRM|nr:hypothetical protein HMPREF1863_00433 [Peptoniphilus coxii]